MRTPVRLLKQAIRSELDTGYDPVKLAQKAYKIYHEYCFELDSEMDELFLQIIAMAEGEEFEFSELEIKAIADQLAH
ncbi:hypothetical protein NX722_18110 [Endozoicomonas gorgoniicola]|uniref:Uncharacterized protein n=1 Tax=Endozoicomonas gorgoniicola TaxID=1234144 RepID=A0ABT3MYP8_9GAMM|nr:hypothetical protein [Endozoicomonas gorgoniicola]MCW7554501.1 hypothetical protein [Endozoicomonas gorgoniicola]